MSKRSRDKRQRNKQPLLGSDIKAIATHLREALRGVVAFRSKLDTAQTEDHLRLLLLENQFPEHCLKALDAHRNLMYALALSAKANESPVEKKIAQELVSEKAPVAPKVDRGLSKLAALGRRS